MGEGNHKVLAITVINIFLLMLFFLLWGCSNDQKNQNRLQFSSSPYLREHADNPVNWFEWSDEALNKAEKENKPLLISIGYAACHWCHVMEEESFMDTAVARMMNENFICIKVDREEHPDIDKIYMDALQQLSGNAGWPLNAFALPDGKPFFAGTYYARNDWMSLLQNIIKTYRTKQKLVVMQAQALYNGMNRADLELTDFVSSNNASLATEALVLYDSLIKASDTINGGIKGTLKFPSPAYADMLLQHHYISGNKQALEIALHTLNSMAQGGIYDQVGGGFARYATDSNWRIPHFEKMLYDNGLLVSVYAHAYQLTKNDWYKTVIRETIDFVEGTLAAPGGGFFSSVNADTKDGEGKFYSWNTGDFLAATQQDSLLAEYFHITSPGNWKQEDNIPYVTKIVADFALEKKIPPDQFNNRLLLAKKRLMEKRNMRTKPTIDTKIITAWNSIMIKGYADAYAATGTEEYLRKARNAADFIEKQLLSEDGSLLRITSAGQVKVPGIPGRLCLDYVRFDPFI